jgi:RNase P subunit RPR2
MEEVTLNWNNLREGLCPKCDSNLVPSEDQDSEFADLPIYFKCIDCDYGIRESVYNKLMRWYG